jgi:hypothetical protein
MKCAICGIQIDSVEDAIDQGWTPYTWDGGQEKDGPFCPSCSETLIEIDEVGEYAVKEEYQGKIVYQEGDFFEEEPPEHVSIGIILKDGGN